MPHRVLVSTQLAKFFGVLSHPTRVRIIQELRGKDLSVNDLKEALGISQAAVSQQLSVLRNVGLLTENRQGRMVYNHLRDPELATWITKAVKFISPDTQEIETMLQAIASTQDHWETEPVRKKQTKA